VLTALTVPDICSALELPNSVFVKEKHYVAFVDKYTTPRQPSDLMGNPAIGCGADWSIGRIWRGTINLALRM
jgi:hypothetical protein